MTANNNTAASGDGGSGGADFTGWLHAKLRDLNTDEHVFGDYIIGILDDGDTDDDGTAADSEKREALHDIISQIDADDVDTILEAIVTRWRDHLPLHERLKNGGAAARSQPAAQTLDIEEQLAKLLEGKTIAAAAVKAPRQPLSAEEIRIRDQILAQYSQVELDECDADDDGGPPPAGAAAAPSASGAAAENDPLMEKNTNALDVQLLAKERREQARTDSKAKKDKDKEDR